METLTKETDINGDIFSTIRDTINKIRWPCLETTPFAHLYEFFANLLSNTVYNEYKYILFKTRRSFVLFELFVDIFEEEYQKFNHKSTHTFVELYSDILEKVYNDAAIGGVDFMVGYEQNKKHILIVDDILIHGRTLSKLVDDVFPELSDEELRVLVFLRNTDAQCISDKLNKSLICKHTYGVSEWESTSNAFVVAIQQSGICYSSFAPQHKSIAVPNFSFSDFEKFIPEENEVTMLSGLKTEIYYPNKKNGRDNRIYKLIRKYEYRNGDVLFVPFIVLPSYDITSWENIYGLFCEKLYDDNLINDTQRGILSSILKNGLEGRYEFCFKFVSYVLSEMFFYSTISNLEDWSKRKVIFLHSTFGKDVANIINDIINNLISCKDKVYAKFEAIFTQQKDFYLTYDNCSDEENKIFPYKSSDYNHRPVPEKVVNDYISELNSLNERRVVEQGINSKRFYGFDSVYMFENLYPDSYEQRYEFLCSFVSRWDCGKSSFIPIKKGNVIMGCMADGEQAYHEMLGLKCLEAINCFYQFLRFENNILSKAISEYKKFVEYCQDNSNRHVKELQTVLRYAQNRGEVKGLKNLYSDRGLKTDLINIFVEYQKERRAR